MRAPLQDGKTYTLGRWRGFVSRILALCLGIALSLCISESVLRIPTLPIPEALSMKLFSCYGPEEFREIYFLEPKTRVLLQKPFFQARCGFHRLRWSHRGDRWGFRNPETWEHVDIALLGDSMIYGHGAEEENTVAHYMREQLHVRVGNLGITGGSPIEYLMYLRNFALRLKPRVVLVVVFANDIDDISGKRDPKALQAFLDGADVPELGIHSPEELFSSEPRDEPTFMDRVERASVTYQTLAYYEPFLETWIENPSKSPFVEEEEPPRPDPPQMRRNRNRDRPLNDPPKETDTGEPLAIAYAKRAFRVMAQSAREAGTTLVIGYLPGKRRRDPFLNRGMELLLGNIAAENELLFLDLSPMLLGPNEEVLPEDRIPVDGHLTARGAERAATAITRWLLEKKLLN